MDGVGKKRSWRDQKVREHQHTRETLETRVELPEATQRLIADLVARVTALEEYVAATADLGDTIARQVGVLRSAVETLTEAA